MAKRGDSITVGTRVRSHYRARWTGVVVEDSGKNHCGGYLVRCLVTHDRRGNPVRKSFTSMVLDTAWLETLDPAPSDKVRTHVAQFCDLCDRELSPKPGALHECPGFSSRKRPRSPGA